LSVAASQAAILEEDLLRLSGSLTGHRYLFGLAVPGGLSRDFNDAECRHAVEQAQELLRRLNDLFEMLRFSSSFLDRLEGVGVISSQSAREQGLVGPLARASDISGDLRKAQAYCGYEQIQYDEVTESEGDGFARLRVLYREAEQSVRIMAQISTQIDAGDVLTEVAPQRGAHSVGPKPQGRPRSIGSGWIQRGR